MHPDLYLTMYRQQMRDLERRLAQQQSAELRVPPRRHRPHTHLAAHLSLHLRRAAHT